MDKICYKTHYWPRNPEAFQLELIREPVYGENQDGERVFLKMGPEKLTVTGSGAFTGPTAQKDYLALVTLFRDKTPGNLITPHWGTIVCYFTQLELTQEPREDYVSYRFTFRGADGDGAIPE